MSGDIWAARDKNGELSLFKGEPSLGLIGTKFIGNTWSDYLTDIDGSLLPDLNPGEKCRVKIERAE